MTERPVRAAGVDVGGTKILVVAVDDEGQVVSEVRRETPPSGVALLRSIEEALEALGARRGRSSLPVGVGVPGLVDRSGTLRFSPHLPAVVGTRLTDVARGPCWVGNDATAAGWAEHRLGAGRGVTDLLMVTLGTGIGGGIVAGGRLVEGAHGFAGECGHMVVDPHGPDCPCGKRGCWERFASGSGLGRLGREAAQAGQVPRVVTLAGGDPEAVRGEHVTTAAREGDGAAASVMARFAWWLALGLANLANVLDPAAVVIGGGLVDAGDVLMGPLRAAFGELVEAGAERTGTAIVPAALGSRAGAVGAALLAMATGG